VFPHAGVGLAGRGVRHNLLVPIQRWRCPVALQVKAVVLAAAGVVVAGVFFPLWFGVPVMVVLGAWGLGLGVRRAEVVVDPEAGTLVFRVGFLARRVALADVTAVQADGAKVSIARSGGGEISVYAWRKSRLDQWLRIPVVAGDVAHAVSRAAAAAPSGSPAQEADTSAAGSPAPTGSGQTEPGQTEPARPAARSGRVWVRSRQPLAVLLLGGTGVLAVVAAFLVRVGWPSPVMTVLGLILALGLGVSGLFYVLFALWLLLGRLPSSGVLRGAIAPGSTPTRGDGQGRRG
jgi:hypothetical protein